MLIRDIEYCVHKRVADGTLLCELLHPARSGHAIALRCSIAHAVLGPGACSRPHRLKTSTELYYILAGTGVMHIGAESAPVKSGQLVYIPPGIVQSLENTGDDTLSFLCIVDPMWDPEDDENLSREQEPL